jgi:hypothetical protein
LYHFLITKNILKNDKEYQWFAGDKNADQGDATGDKISDKKV